MSDKFGFGVECNLFCYCLVVVDVWIVEDVFLVDGICVLVVVLCSGSLFMVLVLVLFLCVEKVLCV